MSLLDGIQSALNPASSEAMAIATLGWALIVGAAIVFALTMALVAIAVRYRPAWLARDRTILLGGVAFPAIVLVLILLYSLSLATGSGGPPALRIEVIGHQWWWNVRYLGENGAPDFDTANEIRLPAGRRVEVSLASNDVLHSLWVPNLAGKLDLVPGRVNRMQISADRPGVFRGQCAEFCGGPHGQMGLFVVVETPEAFEQWRARQRQPAAATDELFDARCAVCHALRGTQARGTLGPDLTHVGSRTSIAAASLPNDPDAMARWIASSQHVKPGNLMPAFADLAPDELRRLAAFLARLQ